MANFAIIEDRKVTNTILADSKAIAEEVTGRTCVEFIQSNLAHIGFGYDGTTFEQPVQEEEPTE
jgi:hypothetical protein